MPARTAATLKMYLSRPDAQLPAQIESREAAQEIMRLYLANGGATFSLRFGNQSGQRLYAVCIYPERSLILEGGDISIEDIHDYLSVNKEWLADPRCCIGIWYSEESDITYLDISILLPQKRAALVLGKRYNQEGIFDLYRAKYIPTGGTGEPTGSMPAIKQRLPILMRGRRGKP